MELCVLENIERGNVGLAGGQSAAQTKAQPRVAWRMVVATVAIALAVWLPRAFQLDHFVTIDESKWLVRSANFYQAVSHGNLIDTFQHGHPGVMIMYAGTAGYLWQFPDYVAHEHVQHRWGDEFMDLLQSYGYAPIDMLAAGRTFVVIFNVIALTLAFLYAVRLIGLWPAFAGFILIAFDPFHAALSRFLHPDSLLSTFMLLATLAFLAYHFAGRRLADLIAAGAFTALAWLTKTPSIFLIPLFGLITLIELAAHVTARPGWRWQELVNLAALWRVVRALAIWAVAAVAVYFALWPALWVNPEWTLAQVFDISSDYATQGHSSPVFFNGAIYNGDPGFWFYPINYLWRTTPIVMVGVMLLGIGFFLRDSLVRRRAVMLTVISLAASILFFDIFMSLAAKKFDRYLLPVFMPFDLLAAIGWVAMLAWLAGRVRARWSQVAAPGLLGVALLVQAGLAINTYPYYMSYYNPTMGGADKAEEVMFIGWGEGLDEAARYLNQTVDTAQATVASWYERGPFSFFYDGPTSSNRYVWEADYAVIYNHQWQRELPSRRMIAYFDTLTPIHSVWLDGINYAGVYDMRDAPPAPYSVEWGDAIRLVYYDTYSGAMYPGQRFDMTIYWVKTGELDIDYNIKLRLVNQDGHELLKSEGKPLGMPTSKWEIGSILRDNAYRVDIPPGTPPGLYRMEISFYDPATFDHLTGVQLSTGNPVSDPYVLDYLIVGDWPPAPRVKVNPPVVLGDKVALEGAALLQANGDRVREVALDGQTFAPGDPINLRLHWRVTNFIHTDYTTLVHVVGPDGTLVTQGDHQPLQGFIPTSYWPPRQTIADDYSVQLPADAPPGEYRLLVGWYDLDTMQRLPMTRRGDAAGDAYEVGTFTVQP